MRVASLKLPILLVEDSPEDYQATVRAFVERGVEIPMIRVADGEEALDYLFGRGDFAEPGKAPRPSLVLLDLNLPGTDGFEVLQELKADPELRRIPVVVLTTSADERDVERCYEEGANSFVRKSADLTSFVEAIGRLHGFWFEVAVLPMKTTGAVAAQQGTDETP